MAPCDFVPVRPAPLPWPRPWSCPHKVPQPPVISPHRSTVYPPAHPCPPLLLARPARGVAGLTLLAADLDGGRAASLDLGAGVREASALDLIVCQGGDLRAGERARGGRLHTRSEGKRSGKASRLPAILLGGHLHIGARGSGGTRRNRSLQVSGRAGGDRESGGQRHGDGDAKR